MTPDLCSRAMALVLPGERVLCPHGHPISDRLAPLPAVVRQCAYRPARDRAPCEDWLWILSHGDGAHTVVWLLPAEADQLRRRHLLGAAARDFLGLTWPRLQAAS